MLHEEKKQSRMSLMHKETKLEDDLMLDVLAKDVLALSNAHWKDTTVRDQRNPTDLMIGSKFPHEDRPAQQVVQELIAIYLALQTRWEAFQFYQVWAERGKEGPEPTFQDELTGEAISGMKGLSPSPLVNKLLNALVGLTLKQFTSELQEQVLVLC